MIFVILWLLIGYHIVGCAIAYDEGHGHFQGIQEPIDTYTSEYLRMSLLAVVLWPVALYALRPTFNSEREYIATLNRSRFSPMYADYAWPYTVFPK